VDSIANKLNDHLAHWEERDEWFNLDNITVPYKEVWHGSRFRELSFFWDEERERELFANLLPKLFEHNITG
jgi:hypothetical protein